MRSSRWPARSRERPAAVVIAGTGSAGYGESANRDPIRAGGFGFLFGDEGSSFSIARTALAAAMRLSDRGGTDLGAARWPTSTPICGRCPGGLVAADWRPQLAGFSRLVLDAARLGDPGAAGSSRGGCGFGGLGHLLVEQLGSADIPAVPVAFVGGTMESAYFRATSPPDPRCDPARPGGGAGVRPAVGAALLACDAAGLPRPPI